MKYGEEQWNRLFINVVFNKLFSSTRLYTLRYIFSYTIAVRKVKRGSQWWILAMLVREFSSFANKRPADRCRRPRWQLKFHFNPEFPQYFSIPPGLVLVGRLVEAACKRVRERAAKIGTPVQREQKSKQRHIRREKNRVVEEEGMRREVNVSKKSDRTSATSL